MGASFTDETFLTHLMLTSCYASLFITGHRQELVHGLGAVMTNILETEHPNCHPKPTQLQSVKPAIKPKY